jgi:hypothetical protein
MERGRDEVVGGQKRQKGASSLKDSIRGECLWPELRMSGGANQARVGTTSRARAAAAVRVSTPSLR